MIDRPDKPKSERSMGGVLEQLRRIDADTAQRLLDAEEQKRAADSAVGILLVKLDTIEPVRTEDGLEYHYYVARIFSKRTGAQNFVTPHYHTKGEEPYRFLSGSNGEMNTGIVENDRVTWNPSGQAVAGAEHIVQEREVHSLRNAGSDSYDFAFACPTVHLVDYDAVKAPDGDRFIVKDKPGGIPGWYY